MAPRWDFERRPRKWMARPGGRHQPWDGVTAAAKMRATARRKRIARAVRELVEVTEAARVLAVAVADRKRRAADQLEIDRGRAERRAASVQRIRAGFDELRAELERRAPQPTSEPRITIAPRSDAWPVEQLPLLPDG